MAADWEKDLVYREGRGKTDPTLVAGAANAITILSNDPAWSDVLAYDTFGESIITLSAPPWDDHDAPEDAKTGAWRDEDTVRTCAWLARHWKLHIGSMTADEAVAVVARRREVHAVREYLRTLAWDGVARIDTWLVDCAGCEDTPYVRAVGAKFLISAVARAEQPGSKVDTVPVLEGEQGARKSSLVRSLCPDERWFLETQADVGSKDSMQQLRRRWIVELAELDALSRAEMAKVKAFFSTRVDTYRASYGRHARDYPRQCVFVGTTNQVTYLRDETGARRFWPVRVGAVDIAKLVTMRDQLWAEARARFLAGEAWHIDSAELAAVFAMEQEDRYQGDPWEPAIGAWILNPGHPERRRNGVTTGEVLGGALNIEAGRWGRYEEMRVAAVLRRLGWERGPRESIDGVRARRYRPRAAKVVQVGQEVGQDPNSRDNNAKRPSDLPDLPNVDVHIRAPARTRARSTEFVETGCPGWSGCPGEAPDATEGDPGTESLFVLLDEQGVA